MRRMFMTVMLAVILLGLGITTIWVRTRVLAMRYEVKKVAQSKESLEEKLRLMTLEIATLKAPQRLAKVASQSRGLRAPQSQDIVPVP